MSIFNPARIVVGRSLRRLKKFYLRRLGVEIGEDVFISLGAKIDTSLGKVVIKDNALITNGCFIVSHGPIQRINPEKSYESETIIGENAFIGVNSVVLMGVEIGENSIVGAGSVVTEDVTSNTVVMGNPAKKVKEIE